MKQAHFEQGKAFLAQGRLMDALDCFGNALALAPRDAEALLHLAVTQFMLGRFRDVVVTCQRLLIVQPDSAETHDLLGSALYMLHEITAAREHYRQAVALKPDFAEAHHNLGAMYQVEGQFAAAECCYRQAIALKPDYAEAHFDLGATLLTQGRYAEGWPEYDWVTRIGSTQRHFDRPVWDGSPLEGRTILVHALNGFGDTLQFVRYLPMVKAQGGRVVFACQPELFTLLRQSDGFDEIVDYTAIADANAPGVVFDVYDSLMNLPARFHTDEATLPAQVPYVWVDAEREGRWRGRVSGFAGLKAGIVWAARDTPSRSTSLRNFAPLARLRGVTLFSLQKGSSGEPAAIAAAGVRLVNLMPDVSDFADTAALISHLDLVITVDTSIAHLAGALGKPVWTLLAHSADWRWLRDRADSPWYPTMRLFRQPTHGDWESVFQAVTQELQTLLRRAA